MNNCYFLSSYKELSRVSRHSAKWRSDILEVFSRGIKKKRFTNYQELQGIQQNGGDIEGEINFLEVFRKEILKEIFKFVDMFVE